uniref:ATPase/GTPase, AAA15 family n=1 Tax=Candidatus Kentrum sp. LPFa TaxID=2126335 RepID=A0A450X9D1_9GAMM|nr:MAG: ATPase/GTPase, AAA15 family [Candidatus Kentron sp. LPFa]VFK25937.1 MAG: ATPase/GTPase, AAA15 family [Candidatus Kentron sp. LPFa]
MIHSFEAENFRLFDKVKINRFNQVNLIVGKNNAGKTALLEALLLFFSRMSPDVIPELIEARQEYWLPAKPHGRKLFSSLMHFFKGHKTPNLDEEGFKLSSNNEDSIHVRTAAYVFEESEGEKKPRRVTQEEIESFGIFPPEFYIISESGNSASIVTSLQEDAANLKRLASVSQGKAIVGQGADTQRYKFVSARGIDDKESASLWDGISLTDLEEDLLKGLRVIEPKLVGLRFVTIDHDVEHYYQAPGRIPLVKPDRNSDPVPLKSLGDGIIRIFHIILSLVSAKGGILLIDEFENGLHWEVQEKAWRTVFELAGKLNVQVFATTHSRDCITSFSKVWKENAEKGAFIRIAKAHDRIPTRKIQNQKG